MTEQLRDAAAVAVLQGLYASGMAEGYPYTVLAQWAWDQADARVETRQRQPEEAIKPGVVPLVKARPSEVA